MYGSILAVGLSGAGLLPAVPPGDSPERVPPKERNLGRMYAERLYQIIGEVRQQYVRDVPEVELIRAALTGIYEPTRRVIPPELLSRLGSAKTSGDRRAILAEARTRLGDAPHLRNSNDVLLSLRALPTALDQHCGLISSQRAGSSPQRSGLGFSFEGMDDSTTPSLDAVTRVPYPWRVGNVDLGSPAQQAGVRPGDVITAVNGTEVTPANAQELLNGLRQPFAQNPRVKDPTSRLTLRREGREASISVEVVKNDYVIESVFGLRRSGDGWEYMLDREAGVGYVRLGFIQTTAPGEFFAALNRMKSEGLRGLILDLRWCPGGYLTPAVQVTEPFLDEGVIATATYRDSSRPDQVYSVGQTAFGTPHLGDVPVVVLVNGQTSGAGELIAAALKDHGRATVVGQRTRGKASIQSVINLIALPGFSFKVTQGEFVRPNKKGLERYPDSRLSDDWGVRPEPRHRFSLSGGASRRLEELALLQALRPAGSREALPLDDPNKDPQRLFALKAMRELLAEPAGEESSEPKPPR